MVLTMFNICYFLSSLLSGSQHLYYLLTLITGQTQHIRSYVYIERVEASFYLCVGEGAISHLLSVLSHIPPVSSSVVQLETCV